MNQPQPRNPAETYEQYFVPAMFLPWATILLRHAALQSGERVLDVACGAGIGARPAAPLAGSAGGWALCIVLQAPPPPPFCEALMDSVARNLSLPVSAVMTPFALCDADELRTLFTAAGVKKVGILPASTTGT